MRCNRGSGITRRRWIRWTLAGAWLAMAGCSESPPEYRIERSVRLPGPRRQVWAIAPVLNLSGQRDVDPILQADLVYQQLQQVEGLTVVPVNRVAEVYAALRLKDGVQSEKEAAIVCDLLGCDGLVVPTVTLYDPYNPPKLGASLQLFLKPTVVARPAGMGLSPHELERIGTAPVTTPKPSTGGLVQVVGVYDAANGSVRAAVFYYAEGRNDPTGPFGAKEYLMSMDRYCGFVYHVLILDLLNSPGYRRASGTMGTRTEATGEAAPLLGNHLRETSANGRGKPL